MRGIRLLVLMLMLSLVLPAAAQNTPRTIPVESRGYSLRVAPDGKSALIMEDTAIASNEPRPANDYVRLLNIESGASIVLDGPTDYARSASYAPDGTHAATFHNNGDIFIWNADGTLVKRINTLLLGGGQIQYFADGKSLLILRAGSPGLFLIMDTETGAITHILGRHFDHFSDYGANFQQTSEVLYTAFALSPDEKTVVAANARGGVVMWDIAGGEETVLVPTPDDDPGNFPIRTMQFTADGKLAYFDSDSNLLHRWDIAAKTESTINVGDLVFAISPDGNLIVWADRKTGDVYAAALNAPGGDASRLIDAPEGYRAFPQLALISFSPDGKTVFIGGLAAAEGNTPIYVLSL